MKTLLRLLFGSKINKEGTLSGFFEGGLTREKKEIIEDVIAKSNRDQRELVERSKQKLSTGA